MADDAAAEEEEEEEETACVVCGSSENAEQTLLCDKCDDGTCASSTRVWSWYSTFAHVCVM